MMGDVVTTDDAATAESSAGKPAALDLEALHARHYGELVRLAALVLGDRPSAEEVVQEAFARTLENKPRMREPDRAVSYLRSAVLNGCRNRVARRNVARRLIPFGDASSDAVVDTVLANERQQVMLDAIRRLSPRQRDCLLLRCYLGLSEAETATTLRIKSGSVKTHMHRALKKLAASIGDDA